MSTVDSKRLRQLFNDFGRTVTQELETTDAVSVRDMNQISLVGTPIIGLANKFYKKEIPNLTLFPARKPSRKESPEKKGKPGRKEEDEEVKKSINAGVIQKVEILSSNKLPSVTQKRPL